MPSLVDKIDAVLAAAFAKLSLPTHAAKAIPSGAGADFQCNAAMAMAKTIGIRPLDLASQVCTAIDGLGVVAKPSGPGFINLWVSDQLLGQSIEEGWVPSYPPRKIMVDFGGPNVAKPLHVGHLRSLVIGESLRRILLEAGSQVVSDIHLGDWGLQMGQLISALEIEMPDLPYFDAQNTGSYPVEPPVTVSDLETLYPQAAAACKHDPERLLAARKATAELQAGRSGYVALWSHFRNVSLAAIEPDIVALGAHFDLLMGEADVNDAIAPLVDRLLENGLAEMSEGAVVIPVAEITDGERPLPPLILRKSDGAALYGSTDLATIAQRMTDISPDEIIYVVDQRQADHFTQVFRAARKVGIVGQEVKLTHAGFGTVNGADGKPLKTRAGGTVRLSALLKEATSRAIAAAPHVTPRAAAAIGVAALKFADLSGKRLSSYAFNMEQATSLTGKTGPYLQYALVRAKAILKNTEAGAGPAAWHLMGEAEHSLALQLAQYPQAFARAHDLLEPSEITSYAFQLAQAFSRFYAECPVSAVDDPKLADMRRLLCSLTATTMTRCLHLVGIQPLETM